MKIISKQRPYFDAQGNLYMPNDLKFGGELHPSLKLKEWWFLVLTMADKKSISEEYEKRLFENTIGSKSNIYRIKRSLKTKGYL